MSTHYETLGVDSKSTFAAIQKAYRHASLLYHPDKDSSLGASKAFFRVQEAYTVLRDRTSREEYDSELRRERTKQLTSVSQELNTHKQMRDLLDFRERKEKKRQEVLIRADRESNSRREQLEQEFVEAWHRRPIRVVPFEEGFNSSQAESTRQAAGNNTKQCDIDRDVQYLFDILRTYTDTAPSIESIDALQREAHSLLMFPDCIGNT